MSKMFDTFLGIIIKHFEKSQVKQRFKKFFILMIGLGDIFILISFIMRVCVPQFSIMNINYLYNQ